VSLNLTENSCSLRLTEQLLRWRSFDAVVVLHSAFSNVNYLYPQLIERLLALKCPKAMFLGNEYKLMPEKSNYVSGATRQDGISCPL
jgi:hypothetical protein